MSSMEAVRFYGERDVRTEEVELPTLQDSDDALIRIDMAAICGTDLHPYHGRMDIEEGFVMGHEYMGTVTEVGPNVDYIEEGDKVVGSFLVCCGKCWYCRRGIFNKCMGAQVFGLGMAFGDLPGTQAQYARIPRADLTLRKLPKQNGRTMADDAALFVGDILTTGYHAVREAGVGPGDTVAIVGAGPVGLCALMSARALGAAQVVVVDMVSDRLKLAEKLGGIPVNPKDGDPADVVLDLTDWRGADVVVDAVGHESAIASAFTLVRPMGTISVAGVYLEDDLTIPIGDLWVKNVNIRMGIANIQGHMDELLELIAVGKLDPAQIISHRMTLADAPEGYALFDSKEAMKVVLTPNSVPA